MARAAAHKTVIHRHSGWLIPLSFLLAVLVLCGLFLAWYLRPGPRVAAPSGDAALVHLTVAGLPLAIPGNYVASPGERRGGVQTALTLTALLPDMRGYSDADATRFSGNAPDSPLVHLLLRADANSLVPRARLARIYLPSLAEPEGAPGPFGLTRYRFLPQSPYSHDELFEGDTASGPLLLLCERARSDLPSPSCIAMASPPAANVSFSYRFKRAWLADWRQIAVSVNSLMKKFRG